MLGRIADALALLFLLPVMSLVALVEYRRDKRRGVA